MKEQKDFLARTHISVRQEGSNWIIQGHKRTIRFNETDFRMEISAGKRTWSMIGAQPDDLALGVKGEKVPISFLAAKERTVSPYYYSTFGGIMIHLKKFTDEEDDLEVRLSIVLEYDTEEILFGVVGTETGVSIKECSWPKAFEAHSTDVTVVPQMQGLLLPRDWPEKFHHFYREMYSMGFYMPWVGFQQGESAAIYIYETPVDGACKIDHPAGGPTSAQVQWLHSLGKMRYPRKVRLAILERGDYVGLCKRYRQYAIETGNFVSLKEKICRTPMLERLIGHPIVHTNITSHIEPESIYYKKDDPSKNHTVNTFDKRIDQLKKLHAMGVRQAYLHLDGWGYRGYDNFHPDPLPPSPDAGGWEGMKRFADVCRELNYLLAIHDQYRDYYWDGPAFDERHAVILESGDRYYHSIWAGGKQSMLCSSFAATVQARNHRALKKHGVDVKGAYLDVFSIVPPEECYNPEHPVTRRECIENWGRCFEQVRSILGVVSSEEPCDWAIPHLDLVHHGPYARDPNPDKGPAVGIPVPLFSLVYHDALLLPWSADPKGKAGFGIPPEDNGYLHALLNAGMAYVSLEPSEAEMKWVNQVCSVHERLALQEMVSHEFLDDARRRQRTTFSDGTTITVDFERDTWEVSPPISPAK